jgi:hypothetical protein
MRAALVLLFMILMLSPVSAQTDSGAIPFCFTSRGTPFGVQGDFQGDYRIEGDSIHINLTKATIVMSEHCPYQGRNLINSINFGLRVKTGERTWKIETRGQPVNASVILMPKVEYVIENVTFRIPLNPEADLNQRWLMVEIQTDAVDHPQSRPGSGYVFAFDCLPVSRPELALQAKGVN